jgi:hypothetical protein
MNVETMFKDFFGICCTTNDEHNRASLLDHPKKRVSQRSCHSSRRLRVIGDWTAPQSQVTEQNQESYARTVISDGENNLTVIIEKQGSNYVGNFPSGDEIQRDHTAMYTSVRVRGFSTVQTYDVGGDGPPSVKWNQSDSKAAQWPGKLIVANNTPEILPSNPAAEGHEEGWISSVMRRSSRDSRPSVESGLSTPIHFSNDNALGVDIRPTIHTSTSSAGMYQVPARRLRP